MGDLVLPSDGIGAVEALLIVLGLPPRVLTDRWYLNSQKYDAEGFFSDRSGKLRREFEDARAHGKPTFEILQQWRDLQESRRELGFRPQPVSLLYRAAERAPQREANTVMGVKYDGGNERFLNDTARLLGN